MGVSENVYEVSISVYVDMGMIMSEWNFSEWNFCEWNLITYQKEKV